MGMVGWRKTSCFVSGEEEGCGVHPGDHGRTEGMTDGLLQGSLGCEWMDEDWEVQAGGRERLRMDEEVDGWGTGVGWG